MTTTFSRTVRVLAAASAGLVLLTACTSEPAPSPTVTVHATVTAEPAPAPVITVTAAPVAEPEPAELTYPSGDPVFDGYPVLVDTSSLDRRLENWIDTDQAVALAPGVYVGFSKAVPDLADYLDGPNSGDCAVRDKYFPNSGGSCWNGVTLSKQEPGA